MKKVFCGLQKHTKYCEVYAYLPSETILFNGSYGNIYVRILQYNICHGLLKIYNKKHQLISCKIYIFGGRNYYIISKKQILKSKINYLVKVKSSISKYLPSSIITGHIELDGLIIENDILYLKKSTNYILLIRDIYRNNTDLSLYTTYKIKETYRKLPKQYLKIFNKN